MAQLFVPLDGRITSQNILSGPLDGTEVQEIVWPGNANQGNTYQVTTAIEAAFYSAWPYLNTELITSGATSISPYRVLTTDTRILFYKTIGSASYAVLPLAATMQYSQPVLFKDLKGDAFPHNITITFSGGELCDGSSSVIIDSGYGWVTINPAPAGVGGAWYLT